MVKRKSRPQVMARCGPHKSLARAQGGYLMMSMMIVLFVTAALMTLYAERQAERSRLERGEQIGYALSVLGAGFNVYLDDNYAKLAADQPSVPGIVNALQPNAGELIRQANIRGVAPVPPVIAGASYKFLVSYPSGCNAVQKLNEARCRPVGLAYIDKPLMRGTKADYVALARAARVMNGQGGYSRPESAARFTFPDSVNGLVPLPISNPVGVAGVLAWRADTLPKEEERLKVNGSNRMNNTLRLNGKDVDHDLIGAKNIIASGTLESQDLNVQGDSTTGGNQIVNGRLVVRNGSGTSKAMGLSVGGSAIIGGNIAVDGDATIDGRTDTDTLYFTQARSLGQYCDRPLSMARTNTGAMVICQDNKWEMAHNDYDDYTIIRVPILAPTASSFTIDLGNYVYCRHSKSDSGTVKYDTNEQSWIGADTNTWVVHEYFCYKKIP